VRDDQREHAARSCERILERPGVEQSERQVNRVGGDAVQVVVDLASVQRHAQPDSLLLRMLSVVPAQRADQRLGQQFDEQCLRHIGRGENEYAVASILAVAVLPRDIDSVEG
jgi:hypothetical protein